MSRDSKAVIKRRFAKIVAMVLCVSIFAVSAVGCAGNDSGKDSSSATTATVTTVADTTVIETTESTIIAATVSTTAATTVTADAPAAKATNKAVVRTTKKVVATTKKKDVTTKAKATAVPTTETKTTTNINTSGAYNSELSQEVFNIVNERRADNGKSALKYNSEAQAAADLRAKELATIFSHTRPDGRKCYTVSDDFELGIDRFMSGENIAGYQQTADEVMGTWMSSPGHKANILADASSIAVGIYKAKRGYYWVQIFFTNYSDIEGF